MYNLDVDRSFRMGMMWFIMSEVLFFAVFFGALFYARQLSVPWLGGEGVKIFNKLLLWQSYDRGLAHQWSRASSAARPTAPSRPFRRSACRRSTRRSC